MADKMKQKKQVNGKKIKPKTLLTGAQRELWEDNKQTNTKGRLFILTEVTVVRDRWKQSNTGEANDGKPEKRSGSKTEAGHVRKLSFKVKQEVTKVKKAHSETRRLTLNMMTERREHRSCQKFYSFEKVI